VINPPRIAHILDDDPDEIMLMKRVFSENGFHVEGFTDAEDFIKHSQYEMPDVLIVDYRMGDDGEKCLEIIERFRAPVPIIIVCTGLSDDVKVIRNCRKAGAISVASKDDIEGMIYTINYVWINSTTEKVKRAQSSSQQILL